MLDVYTRIPMLNPCIADVTLVLYSTLVIKVVVKI